MTVKKIQAKCSGKIFSGRGNNALGDDALEEHRVKDHDDRDLSGITYAKLVLPRGKRRDWMPAQYTKDSHCINGVECSAFTSHSVLQP